MHFNQICWKCGWIITIHLCQILFGTSHQLLCYRTFQRNLLNAVVTKSQLIESRTISFVVFYVSASTAHADLQTWTGPESTQKTYYLESLMGNSFINITTRWYE